MKKEKEPREYGPGHALQDILRALKRLEKTNDRLSPRHLNHLWSLKTAKAEILRAAGKIEGVFA